MPLSVFRKLGIRQQACKKTPVTLELADKSIRFSKGTVEDILVKVDELIFPVDFTVLDMKEDEDIPLILGRPFLATGKALIDVGEGKLTLRALDKQVTFDIHDPVPSTDGSKTCYDIIAKDELTNECVENDSGETTLESVLSVMDDWDDKEHELDKNSYEPPLQENTIKYQMPEAHKSKSEQALIPPPPPELNVFHDDTSDLNHVNSPNPLMNVDLNPLISELKQELLGHREILGWTDEDIYRASSLISTYRTLVDAEKKGLPQKQENGNGFKDDGDEGVIQTP